MLTNDHNSRFATHATPVWRDRADFVIRSFLRSNNGVYEWEQLWAKASGEKLFEICCIPFFTYGLSLGDIVTVRPKHDAQYVVDSIQTKSGYVTYRVWLGHLPGQDLHSEIAKQFSDLGCLIEWSSKNMFAIAFAPQPESTLITNTLEELALRKFIVYEDGSVSSSK